MKLPGYKPGTLKKALLAFASIGAAGAVIKYKSSTSHSQGHVDVPDELHDDHSLARYLQVSLVGETDLVMDWDLCWQLLCPLG
jgi:hypothetical protein